MGANGQFVRSCWTRGYIRICSVAFGSLLGATEGLQEKSSIGMLCDEEASHLPRSSLLSSNTRRIILKSAALVKDEDSRVLFDTHTFKAFKQSLDDFPGVVLYLQPSEVEWQKLAQGDKLSSKIWRVLPRGLNVAYAEASAAEDRVDSTITSKDVCFSRNAIADAVAKAAPAVVNITVSIGGRMTFAHTAGSGFIIDPDGTILTNAHVVAEEGSSPYRNKIVVTMQDGRNFPGEIVSSDLLADIAVIKVKSNQPLPSVTFGSSRKLRPGEWVVAVGSPLHLQNTVTVGIVSCVDRKSAEMGLRGVHADYIQTDAAINQGNSGGPLLNLDGDVIGINTMKALAADGVSFAIPIDSALRIIQQLKKHGRVVRPWLGMKMLGLTENILAQLKERDSAFPDVNGGVLVPQVIPGSPAARAGVLPGDVIVEFNGRQVSTPHQIVEALEDKVGVPFKCLIRRAKRDPVTISVVTEEASPHT